MLPFRGRSTCFLQACVFTEGKNHGPGSHDILDSLVLQGENSCNGFFLVRFDTACSKTHTSHETDLFGCNHFLCFSTCYQMRNHAAQPYDRGHEPNKPTQRMGHNGGQGSPIHHTCRLGYDLGEYQNSQGKKGGKIAQPLTPENSAGRCPGNGSPRRIGDGVERQDRRDGPLHIPAHFLQYLPCLLAILDHGFDMSYGQRVKNRLKKGTSGGNKNGKTHCEH